MSRASSKRPIPGCPDGGANMKAFWLTTGAGATKVELRETAAPEPKSGQILVRVKAASLNRGELLRGFVRDIVPPFEAGRIHAIVDRVFEFGDLARAIGFMEADGQVGKIVVQVS